MRFIGGSVVFVLGASLFLSSAIQAETFYYKNDKGEVQTTEIKLTVKEDRSIELGASNILPLYTSDNEGIKKGPIVPRVPTEAEQIADAAVMLLTSLLIIATHETYDLSKDMRMSRLLGAFFFIFPFESEDVYRKCGENEYLVAVSDEPKDETLKQLKSAAEIRKLCGGADSSNSSS